MLQVVAVLILTSLLSVKSARSELTHIIGKRSYESRECDAKHMQKALSSNEACLPRDTIVPLPWLNVSNSAQITPTHVSLKRCDGSCHHFGHACLPQATQIVRVPILVGKCGIDSGVCDKECATVEIEEHTECACSCQLLSVDCRANQDYRADLCSCQCRDVLGRQTCLDSGRVWDEAECVCGCRQELECPLGYLLQESTCTCAAADGTSLLGEEEARSERGLHSFPTLEHVFIVVLAAIILLLLVILACLSLRIRRLSRRIQLHQGGSNPLSDSDLEVKQLNPGNPVYGEGSCSTPSSGFYSEIAGHEPNYGLKRESDSLYHSAESVRLKKQRLLEHEAGLKHPVNIIENVLEEENSFIRFRQNMEDSASASPDLSYDGRPTPLVLPSYARDVQYSTLRHFSQAGRVGPPPPPLDRAMYAPNERLMYEEGPAAGSRGYDSLPRQPKPLDISRFNNGHIEEALRILQESADNL